MAMVLQRPLLAGLVVLVLWFALDRAWFSRTGASQWFQRRRLESQLRAKLEINAHDRDARFQLAELLLLRGQHAEARELIERNVAAGDSDDETLFVAGVAAFGAGGSTEDAERYLAKARDKSPTFRSGAIEMALGRGRLDHGQFAAAKEALDDAIRAQPGSVEAHVLLSRALDGLERDDESAAAKARAWTLYTESPRFKRRQTRRWAWRAKPMAAVRYVGAVVAVVAAVVVVVPRLVPSWPDDYTEYGDIAFEEGELEMVVDGFNVDLNHPPPASRFSVAMGDAPSPSDRLLSRADLNGNGTVDMRRKLERGDLWCRLRMHFPELAVVPSQLEIVDSETGTTFGILPGQMTYVFGTSDTTSLFAFEALLESKPPADCDGELTFPGGTIAFGVRDGVAYQRP